ncbi:1,2-diacylglycerol 3-alpha-glucosyltransferase [Gracilibacillus ureilyticus]|uniref:1,2-diacylglycerol 3-alpha-glucosyltransferase n=1 Tax=Gracilibacillus ureilyticus TaxID=531814 RepID=A0A1H9MRC8_9BACI|nr:glycosyltransferase family 4 protein [Gracilibacillus ureilyticus]SER26270.1 1,2-diacylglycerol 3-alpha-glucosyltransferase [Gracilibacillus ureilyticus]
MKILITTEWYSPVINGVVTSIVNLKKELQKLGHEVRVLTLSNEAKSYIQNDITYISSLGVGKIYPGARVTLFKNYKYLQQIMDWRPDVIHSQCEFSTFRIAKHLEKCLQIPIIHTYHTVYEDYTHYFSPNQKWGKAMVAIFSRKVLRNAAYVIAPTEKVSKLLQSYGVKQPIKVIPTGIDLSCYQKSDAEKQRIHIRKQLNIPLDHRLLIFVGRLAKEKNLEEVFTYFSKIERENMSLLVVGDGPQRASLERYARKLNIENNVIFTGMISPEEIPSYYQSADVFVSSSNSETQGLTYIEALASGLPALCRKDPCLESVVEDGVNGWLFENFNEFKCYIERILLDQNSYNTLSANASKKAYDEYSSVAFAKNIENIYYEAISLYHQSKKDIVYINQSGINQ